MRRILLLLLAIAFVMAPTLGLERASAATTTTKYLNGKIAFDTNRDGSYEIYTANPDGSNPTRLTNNSAGDYSPAWSPDGSKIAFTTNRDGGNTEIYVMNADGSNPTRVTNNSASDYNPNWSPDGSKLAFTTNRDGGNNEIYVMNADGSSQTRLTNDSHYDYSPAWSPDGSKIAFNSDRTGQYAIYIMNVDGSNQTKITNGGSEGYVSWSPDGNKIAYFGPGTVSDEDIFIANTDGSNPVNITNSTIQEDSTGFSPDGKKIISTIYDAGYNTSAVYSMNIDGTGLAQLTPGGTYEESYSSQAWQRLPYTATTNDDGTTTSTISIDKDYSTTDYAIANKETLILDGKLGDVTVQSGGILMGSGTAGTLNVEAGGTIAPGHSPGCINSGNLTLNGTYSAQIGGTTACSGYDQIQVTGTVNLTGSTLTPSLVNGFVPTVGNSFTIIDNDSTDAVIGTFAGLSEGATFTSQGITYRVSYVGGTGNDVTLTVTAINAAQLPSAPDTGIKMITANPAIALLATALVGTSILVLTKRVGAKQ